MPSAFALSFDDEEAAADEEDVVDEEAAANEEFCVEEAMLDGALVPGMAGSMPEDFVGVFLRFARNMRVDCRKAIEWTSVCQRNWCALLMLFVEVVFWPPFTMHPSTLS